MTKIYIKIQYMINTHHYSPNMPYKEPYWIMTDPTLIQ